MCILLIAWQHGRYPWSPHHLEICLKESYAADVYLGFLGTVINSVMLCFVSYIKSRTPSYKTVLFWLFRIPNAVLQHNGPWQFDNGSYPCELFSACLTFTTPERILLWKRSNGCWWLAYMLSHVSIRAEQVTFQNPAPAIGPITVVFHFEGFEDNWGSVNERMEG